jgi:hypothetical protein
MLLRFCRLRAAISSADCCIMRQQVASSVTRLSTVTSAAAVADGRGERAQNQRAVRTKMGSDFIEYMGALKESEITVSFSG